MHADRCVAVNPSDSAPALIALDAQMVIRNTHGERVVNTNDWRRWAVTAAEVAASRPEVCSFADLTLAEWMAEWSRKFHADRGRLPAPGTRAKVETALRGLLPRLTIHYSDAPWWKHDLWCLRFDPRIPRRAHEPHGDAMIRWDDIEPAWLREIVKDWARTARPYLQRLRETIRACRAASGALTLAGHAGPAGQV